MTHICVGKITIIGSDNGLSPGRRQAIIWTNAGILLIEPLGTNFSEILIEILAFSFKKMCLNLSSAKWRPFCLGLNVLTISRQWGHVAEPATSHYLNQSWPSFPTYFLRHFAKDNFKFQIHILVCNCVILIQIALEIIPSGPINIYAPFGLNELIKDSVIVLQFYLWLI